MKNNEMMNPFTDGRRTQDTPTDEEVVGGVLGPEAVRALRELRTSTGPKTTIEEEPDFEVTDLELTEAEREAAREAERGPRQEMIDWARTFGNDEEWVDEQFTFHSDGRITSASGELDLESFGIGFIPPVLARVEGLDQLYLNNNKISKLENLPEGLQALNITHNNISKLENLPDGLRELWLNRNPLRSIDGLTAPDKIGVIFFSQGQQALVRQAKKLGYRVDVR